MDEPRPLGIDNISAPSYAVTLITVTLMPCFHRISWIASRSTQTTVFCGFYRTTTGFMYVVKTIIIIFGMLCICCQLSSAHTGFHFAV